MDEYIIDAVIHLTFPLLPETQLRNRCKNGHCEKRSDEAISKLSDVESEDCFAALLYPLGIYAL